jgi:hypothetical protein
MQPEMDTLLQFFKTLANENRLKMLGILAERECGVEELATLLDLKAPTVSHHLGRLRELGVVTMRVEGNDHLFRMDVDGLRDLSRRVLSSLKLEQVGALADGVAYDTWERKVLDVFVEGDEIKALPAGYKKRLVVLRWWANHFEPGRRYSESELDALIERHHPDYCSLRRELIEEHMMARESGVYWRLPWQMPDLTT